MFILNHTKGVHGYQVAKENVFLKPGENEVDDALWAKAKERHDEIRSMIHDRKLVEKKIGAVQAPKPSAPAAVSVDVKTKK